VQFNPTDPGAARPVAEVFQLVAEAPAVGDGSTEWPDEIELDLLSGAEIVLIPPAGLSPAAVEVDASLRTRFSWPDQEDLRVAARVAALESAGQLQASGGLSHPGRSEGQTQVPYKQ